MPSVETLYNLARELHLAMDDLIRGKNGAGQARPGEAHDYVSRVQRHARRTSISVSGGVRWERLTSGSDSDLEFRRVVYGVGAESCPRDSLLRHPGKEYAYLICGTLGVRIGRDEFQLAPGGSIAFDARLPHRLWTIGRKPAVAICAALTPCRRKSSA
jgi:mannose-6-phosphate isomerase-like protein (cupin superfamily)